MKRTIATPGVLIMDNGERFRTLATQALRGAYATVIPASTFAEAARVYENGQAIHVIVTDFIDVRSTMPFGDYLQ